MKIDIIGILMDVFSRRLLFIRTDSLDRPFLIQINRKE